MFEMDVVCFGSSFNLLVCIPHQVLELLQNNKYPCSPIFPKPYITRVYIFFFFSGRGETSSQMRGGGGRKCPRPVVQSLLDTIQRNLKAMDNVLILIINLVDV